MVIGLVGVLVFVVVNALILTWAERKVAGHMQRRIGPKEVGPYGLIQPIADALKLLGKEILTPAKVDKPLYYLAPMLIFVPVLVSFIVIPFDASLQVKDINVGILVILAFSSLSVLSILMAGWGSNNKYSLIGAIRSIAQNIAYEIPLLLALLPVIMMANSFSLKDIVEKQKGLWFVVFQPSRLFHLFYRRCGRDQQDPLRPSRSGKRTGGGLSHGIFRHEIRPVFPCRVYEHFHRQRHCRDVLSRGLPGALSARHRLVSAEVLSARVCHHVAQMDLSPGEVRPVAEFRLESADPSGFHQSAHYGRTSEDMIAFGFIKGTASLIAGLGVTIRAFFQPVVTSQYPRQSLTISPRFRGHTKLLADDGESRRKTIASPAESA